MLTPRQSSDWLIQQCVGISVIPVLVINDVAVASDLARVLVDSGLPVLEVTMRTENALLVMEAMSNVEGAIVGAGTVVNADQIRLAKSAGAQFLVSPGYSDSIGNHALSEEIPLLPGAVTATEVMVLQEKGYHFLKFFPASVYGGVAALKALSGPLPDITFCPTGGISPANLHDYLSLSNVAVAGGSWLVTNDDLANKDWKNIRRKVNALMNNNH